MINIRTIATFVICCVVAGRAWPSSSRSDIISVDQLHDDETRRESQVRGTRSSQALAAFLFGRMPAHLPRQAFATTHRGMVMQDAEVKDLSGDSQKNEAEGDVAKPAESAAPPPQRDNSYIAKLKAEAKEKSKVGAGFNQFDPLLTATNFISRRFGIFGGLAIVGVLAATEGKEILNAVFEKEEIQGSGELITTPSGLQYTDDRISFSGSPPAKGNLIGVDLKISIGDKVLYDTAAKGNKKISFVYQSRPLPELICDGLEEGIATMRPGGRRTLFVPGRLGPVGVGIPGDVTLKYEVELREVLVNYLTR